jgi:hypothetical protein
MRRLLIAIRAGDEFRLSPEVKGRLSYTVTDMTGTCRDIFISCPQEV